MFKNLFKIFINKYVITIIIFIIVVFFISPNNISKHIELSQELKNVQKRNCYLKRTASYTPNIDTLCNNLDSLDKYAREYWNMTKANEDIFIVEF